MAAIPQIREQSPLKKIDLRKLPRHIAIIMDGNGRWAQKHTLGRISGHRKGADAVRATVRTCRELGIGYLTLYAFSVENWQRPAAEVEALMGLLKEFLAKEIDELDEKGIRLMTIGNLQALKAPLRRQLKQAVERTAHNEAMVLNVALSYGGRDEIVEAAKKILRDGLAGRISPDEITRENFAGYLYTARIPDPDLLIRTSGEYRISNFLLWQTAYTEFYFTDVLWPDFQREDLLRAIAAYQARERRFGLTSDQLQKD
ncbi:MAG: isoprenyl transferase [Deltaproteobacteria bacterium]|nr:isoprenyl transferase [Deltaproteobacteria bacterium]